jgi:hypothetical protein
MKVLRTLLICSSAVFLVSCTRHLVPLFSVARFSAPINQSFSLNTNTAVVYGRFATGSDFAFGNELALRLCDEHSKRVYLIRCRDKEPVYAVAVEPGRYRVAGFLATFQDHRPRGKRDFRDSRTFEVRSNSLTYLGDFAGYAKVGFMTEEWGLSGITNNFEATTEELKQQYPNLAQSQSFSIYQGTLKALGARTPSGLPVGDYRFVNSQGSTEAQGHFIDGKMDGSWVFWTSDGTKVAEISYDRGVRSGPFRLYWSNLLNPDFAGKLKAEGKAQDGKQVGEHISYLPDGQVDSRAKILEDGQIQPSIGSSEVARKKLAADDRYFAGLEAAVLGALEEK